MLGLNLRPRLTRRARLKQDRLTGEWLLLSPERGLLLNPSAHSLIALCDGERRLFDIVEHLVQDFPSVPRALLEEHAVELFSDLHDRALLRLEP